MNTHNLKIWPSFFSLHIERQMEFQLRNDDRPYKVGDMLRLMEYDPESNSFSGNVAISRVTSVIRGIPGLQSGYVALGAFFVQMETKHTAPLEETEE